MAKKRSIIVDIKANTTEIKNGIETVAKRMSNLSSIASTMKTGINNGFKDTATAIQSTNKAIKNLNTTLGASNTQLVSMTNVLSKMKTQLTDANNALRDSRQYLIDIKSNTSSTNTKLDNLNSTMGRIETLMRSMNKSMTTTAKATTAMGTAAKASSTAVTTMGTAAGSTAKATTNLSSASAATASSVGLVTSSVQKASASFKNLQSNLSNTFGFMRRGQSALGNLADVFNPRRLVEATGYSMAYGIVDAPVNAIKQAAAGVKQAIDNAGSLEGELYDIEAYLGGADGKALSDFAAKMGETGDAAALKTSSMGMLQQKILEVGQTTSYTSLEIAKAVTEAAKAGITIDELGLKGKGALDSISLLSQNTGEQLETSAQIVGKLQDNFQMNLGKSQEAFGRALNPAEQYLMIVNSLVEADSSSAASASQLTEALYNVGGSANNINMSFFETTALVSSMVPAFESAASAGTSLKYVLSRMTGGGSAKAADAMKAVGLMDASGQSVFFGKNEVTGKVEFKGLRHMVESLRQAFGEESDMAVDVKNKIITDIFGQDALKAVSRMVAMSEGQAQELYDMADQMTESARLQAETAQSVADIKNEGLEFDMEYLSGSLDSIKTTLALPLMKPMSNVVQTMSGIANGFFSVMTKFDDKGALQKELADIKTNLIDESLVPNAEGLFKAAQKYAEGFHVVLKMVTKEGWNLKTISTAIAAILGVAVPDMQRKAAEYAVTLKNAYNAIVDFVKNIPSMLDRFSNFIELVFTKLQSGFNWIVTHWPDIKKALVGILIAMATAKVINFAASFSSLAANIAEVVTEAGGLEGVLLNLNQIIKPSTPLGQAAANAVTNATLVTRGVPAGFFPQPAGGVQTPPPFVNTWTSVGAAANTARTGMWTSIVAGAKAATTAVVGFLTKLTSMTGIVSLLQGLWLGIKAAAMAITAPVAVAAAVIAAFAIMFYTNFNGLRDFIVERFGGIFEYVTSMWNAITASVMSRWEIISAFFQPGGAGYGLYNGLANMFKGIMVVLEGVLVFTGGLIKTVIGILLLDGDLLGQGLRDMAVGVVGFVGGIVKTVLGLIQGAIIGITKLINTVWTFLGGTAIDEKAVNQWFEDLGGNEWLNIGAKTADNLNKGLQNGLVKGTPELANASKKLTTTGIMNPITTSLKERSPSKWAEDVGYNVVQGLVIGIDSNGRLVRQAMINLAEELKSVPLVASAVVIPVAENAEVDKVKERKPRTFQGQETSGYLKTVQSIITPASTYVPLPYTSVPEIEQTVQDLGGRGRVNDGNLAGSATVGKYVSDTDRKIAQRDALLYSNDYQAYTRGKIGKYMTEENFMRWYSDNPTVFGYTSQQMGYDNWDDFANSEAYASSMRLQNAAGVVGAGSLAEYQSITANAYKVMKGAYSRAYKGTAEPFVMPTDNFVEQQLRDIANNTHISVQSQRRAEELIKNNPKMAAVYAKKMGVTLPDVIRDGLDLSKLPKGYGVDEASAFYTNPIEIAPGVGLRNGDIKKVENLSYMAYPINELGEMVSKSNGIVVKAMDYMTDSMGKYTDIVAKGITVAQNQNIEAGRGATSDVQRYTGGAAKQVYDSSTAPSKNVAKIHYDKIPINFPQFLREMEGTGVNAGTASWADANGNRVVLPSNVPLGIDLLGANQYGYGRTETYKMYKDLTAEEIVENAPRPDYMAVAQLPTSDMRGDFSQMNLEEYSTPTFDVSKMVKQFQFATGDKAIDQRGLTPMFTDIPSLTEQYAKIGTRAATFLRMKNGVLTEADQVTFKNYLAQDKADRKAYLDASNTLKSQMDAIDQDSTLTDEQKQSKKSNLVTEFTDKNAPLGRTFRDVYGIDIPSLSEYKAGGMPVAEGAKQYADLGAQKIDEAIGIALNPANQSEAFKKLTPDQQKALEKTVRELPSQAMAFLGDAMQDGILDQTEFEDYMMYAGEDANLASRILARGTGPTDEELDAVYAPYIDGLATVAPTGWFTGPVGDSMVNGASVIFKAMGQAGYTAFLEGWTTDDKGNPVNIGVATVDQLLSYDPAMIKEKGIPTGENFADGIIEGVKSQLVQDDGDLIKIFNEKGELVQVIRKAAVIRSPSEVMRDMVGVPLGLGIIDGMFGDTVQAALKSKMGILFGGAADMPVPAVPGVPVPGDDGESDGTNSHFKTMGMRAGSDFISGFFREDTPEQSLFTQVATKLIATFNPDTSNTGVVPVYTQADSFGRVVAHKLIKGFMYVIDGNDKNNEWTLITALENALGHAAAPDAAWSNEAAKLGENVALGMAAGMTNQTALAAIEKAAKDMICKAVEAARTASDCHSPSRLFAEQVGQPISAGVAEGITNHSGLIDKAMVSAVGSPQKMKFRPDISAAELSGRRRGNVQQVTNNNNYNLGVTTNQSPNTVQKSFEVMRSFEGV